MARGGCAEVASSEGSGSVLRYAVSDGRFIAAVVTGRLQPTGLAYHPDGSLLVVDSTGVTRHDPQTRQGASGATNTPAPAWNTAQPADGAHGGPGDVWGAPNTDYPTDSPF